MIKILLFAILASSINGFAQSKLPMNNSIGKIRGRTEHNGIKTSNIHSERNLGQAFKHQLPDRDSFIQIFDSVYHWQWDTVSNGWKIFSREINMVYDGKNNLISELWQEWNNSTWVNLSKDTYTYDSNHNQTSDLDQDWNGSGWVICCQFTYTYDDRNNKTSDLDQHWNGSAWVNIEQFIYGYDTNNNKTSILSQLWGSSSGWVNNQQYIYTYDANNNMTSELDQFWNGSGWGNFEQYTYSNTYDGNNNLTNVIRQIWNDSIWVNSEQIIYTYDSYMKRKNELNQYWNDSIWVNAYLCTYTYDANNNLTRELDQQWNTTSWVNTRQYLYTYDGYNFTKGYSVKYWDYYSTELTGGDSISYYFTVLGINELIRQQRSISVYPNPSNGNFTISSSVNISSVEIYDLLGQRIYSDIKIDGQKFNEIDLSDHCKGIYLLKIYSGTRIYNRKIIVQ